MAISPHDVADALELFIRREFRITHHHVPLSRDEHLFEGGLVDSAGVVELIMFIETTFNMKLADEHVFSEQFTSINGIADIVSNAHLA